MSESQVFVGIDAAQATLKVAVRPAGEAWQHRGVLAHRTSVVGHDRYSDRHRTP